jgi:hypothetical protein
VKTVGNILTKGLLIIVTGLILLSPLMEAYKSDVAEYIVTPSPYDSSQYSFSIARSTFGDCFATLGEGSNSLQVNWTSGSGFASCLLEKILSYSFLREKYLSKASVKPFPQYILHMLGTQNNYYVYVLREIII